MAIRAAGGCGRIAMMKSRQNDIRLLAGQWRSLLPSVCARTCVSWRGAESRVIASASPAGDHHRFRARSARSAGAAEKLVTIDNIQRRWRSTTKIRWRITAVKRRSRSVARPRQMAMALAKELTNHSLPEIGDGQRRDHTTVRACKIEQLRETTTLKKIFQFNQNIILVTL